MVFVGCKNNKTTRLFTTLSSKETGISFENKIVYSEEINPYTFRNYFNGAGVAIGDINNDSLPDIFFCSNQGSNKLYVNKGDFQFEDITEKAGLASHAVWSTGVTMVDINADGWLDIYVCKSGDIKADKRSNELFVNNQNGTFTEQSAKYGLQNKGLSTHAAFFDYDNDGDLDCYLLNNSLRSVGKYDLIKNQREVPDSLGGNKFFRNDNGYFTNITAQAGIYSSYIGFGLGVAISDINKDGWQDIYVSNDFFEKDYLYLNQKNGRFLEQNEQCIAETSLSSMGADIADINNDGYPEVFVTDMLPEIEERVKTKAAFENWEKYQANVKNGYARQFLRNVLQLNNADKNRLLFTDISRFAGVHATDWSWGALISDLNNDGFKDIFVANGIYKDITDQDYIQYTANSTEDIRQQIVNNEKNIITRLIDKIPSNPISNYAFSNNGDLSFTNRASEWGLGEPSFSNGSAYGDLDNDGDLDLVVNNVNMPCFVYRNESSVKLQEYKFLNISLDGEGKNRFGLGAKVTVYCGGKLLYQEQMPVRGFESSVDTRLHFGLGKVEKIDSVEVQWLLGKRTILKNIPPNQFIKLKESEAYPVQTKAPASAVKTLMSIDTISLQFHHIENEYSDFNRERLSFHMLSTQGPRIAKGDVNGDGLDDVYLCGASGQSGSLLVQTQEGRFRPTNTELLARDISSEDTDALFFDADGDGDQDLYVCSGGSEFMPDDFSLTDRLYFNDGKGVFTLSPQLLPGFQLESSSCVRAADYDQDGDQDLFVGVRMKLLHYGYPCKGYVLQNDGKGRFKDITAKAAPQLQKAGMITDAQWIDYDKDGATDLVVCGEYMPIRMYKNNGHGRLEEVTTSIGLQHTNGWWNRLIVADINRDGYADLVCGNHGLNSRFKATAEKPVEMYVNDFDGNGLSEQIITCYNGSKSYPMALRHDLVGVLPQLKKKYLRYEDYKNQTVQEIFSREQLSQSEHLSCYELQSCVFINRKGKFIKQPLPAVAQLSPIYGICVEDIDRDGKMDLLLGGNFYESKPEAGIYDGSHGLVLKGDGRGGFKVLPSHQTGLYIRGAVRDIAVIKGKHQKRILFAKNNEKISVYHFEAN